MEPSFLICSPKTTQSIVVSPVFLSYKPSLLQKPRLSLSTPLSIPRIQFEKASFFGESIVKIESLRNLKKTHVPISTIRAAAVKRRKENTFDNVIQRDKKLKLVLKIRKILMNQPDRIMALRHLGKYRKALGLDKSRRFIALLKKFPAVFEIVEEGAYSLQFKLTPEAERLYFEEMKVRNEMEDLLVIKLRKLLMMSEEKRILLEKIAHLRSDFGLPLEFRDTICRRYPQYFKVVPTIKGSALELTYWDPELAVTAAEISKDKINERNLIMDRPSKFNRVNLPKGLNLSKGEMRKIGMFRNVPYTSPYENFSHLRSGTIEKEKHSCSVVHEILSLTVEKRTLVDFLTHFRDEFRFSQQLRGMLIRHPDMFYVSLKGDRDSVFLREAYRDSQLLDKNKLLVIKEKLRGLVGVPRFRGKINGNEEAEEIEGENGSEDVEEEWSDIDDNEEEEEDDDDDEDDEEVDWSDEDEDEDDDDSPQEESKSNEEVNFFKKTDTSVVIPVFRDGSPREIW